MQVWEGIYVSNTGHFCVERGFLCRTMHFAVEPGFLCRTSVTMFKLYGLDLEFFKANFEIAVSRELFWSMKREKEVYQLDIGLSAGYCTLIMHIVESVKIASI